MCAEPRDEVTRILNDAALSPTARADRLLPLVYQQLRRIARQRMRGERADHTLQATALVHEAYLRLTGDPVNDSGDRARHFASRAHFFHAAAEAMRRILIDHARARGTVKRGSGRLLRVREVLDLAGDEANLADAMILDELLSRLSRQDPRAAEVVRLRFFAGLSIDETAGVLGVSAPSVKRDWAFARAWLADALREDG